MASGNYDQCFDKCRASCHEVRYDLRLVRMSEMKELPSRERDLSFSIKLRFATNRVEHLNYHPLISYETVLASLGGSFGVCIGIPTVRVAMQIYEWGLTLIGRLLKKLHSNTKRRLIGGKTSNK
ncbi:hypothetical protein BIW11_04185 [Tropilaelaps mercedesae]|uniref:Uncharacterized protein n=1 Tax=Tropilaelaps mercedesae TaxID=418985 RepID=A0A1V9X9T4_9ACAR|nr:hypothetical protein BIW11_04185 [Tropilaelaps mercedesae]